MKAKLHIKKGDKVFILSGEDKGKTGKVLQVFPARMRAVVEGTEKVIKKHEKPSRTNPDGGIITKPFPIHVSNLKKVEDAPKATAKSKKNKKDKE